MASDPKPPRRPFDPKNYQGESFWASSEFQRILWFGGLLVFALLMGLWALESMSKGERAAEVAAPVAAPPPTAEELEAAKAGLSTKFEGALRDTENGQDLVETSGYHRLLQLIASFTPEEFHERTQKRLDYASAMAHPDLWRGEFVRVRGIVAGLQAVKLRSPVFGITDVWRGALTGADGEEGIVVDLVNFPPPFEVRKEPVDVEGVFYRKLAYENQAGRVVEAPYLIVRNLQVVETKPSGVSGFLRERTAAILVAMAVVFGLTRLLMYLFQRRARLRRAPRVNPAATDFHAMFERHMRPPDPGAGPRPPA